jgi:hypothetical protein
MALYWWPLQNRKLTRLPPSIYDRFPLRRLNDTLRNTSSPRHGVDQRCIPLHYGCFARVSCRRMIDVVASEYALSRYGIPPCLLVPIAALDEAAITAHVGEIRQTLSGRGMRRAFLVHAHPSPPIDPCYPIWDEPGSAIFHQTLQVWVHVGFTRYRQAYRRAFPTESLDDMVISHALNRRVAALKGFDFVRITPTSRAANSSSAFAEGWSLALHSEPQQAEANRRRGVFVQYADLTDLMLMLDKRLGGGVMDAVNEGQKLIRPRQSIGTDD